MIFHGVDKKYILLLILLPVLPHYLNDIAQVSGLWASSNSDEVRAKDLFWLFDIVTYFLLPCAVIFIYFQQGWLKWPDLSFHWKNPIQNILFAFLLAAGVWMLFFLKLFYLQNYLNEIYPITNSIGKFFYSPSDGMLRYGALMLYMAFSASIVEEVVYRSFLIQGFERIGMHTWGAVFCSVILFVSVHWASGAGFMVNALIAGTIFSIIYVKTRNILPLVIAHFLIDLSSVSGFDSVLIGWLLPIFK